MQALAVYISVRLSEGETDYNNFDELLVTTVTVSDMIDMTMYSWAVLTLCRSSHKNL